MVAMATADPPHSQSLTHAEILFCLLLNHQTEKKMKLCSKPKLFNGKPPHFFY